MNTIYSNATAYIMKKENRKYYAAYEERYKTAHAHGVSWSSNESTPVVMEVIDKYKINYNQHILEIVSLSFICSFLMRIEMAFINSFATI